MSTTGQSHELIKDVTAIAQIDAVPRILEVVCRTTGMGFSAVARVTETQWIACAVRDEIAFGLTPGGELEIGTTICNEIRQHGRLVVIDDVATDEVFSCHPTPRQYGFRSYISVPILRQDGRFFGTLCAIDPKPARLNTPETVTMFTLFSELIAFHLDADDRVRELEARVAERTEAWRGLAAQQERVREDERTRIARELHDELGQGLTALRLDIGAAVEALNRKPRADLTRTRVALDSMATVVGSTFDSVERIVTELRPAVLDALGIGAAAEWLVSEFARHTGIRSTCTCKETEVSPEVATALFRVLQEALTNVARHASASDVRVMLRQDGRNIALTVEDNGCGIPDSAMAQPTAFGLRGMQERLRAVDGLLVVTCAPARGTILTARCPAMVGA